MTQMILLAFPVVTFCSVFTPDWWLMFLFFKFYSVVDSVHGHIPLDKKSEPGTLEVNVLNTCVFFLNTVMVWKKMEMISSFYNKVLGK